MSFNKYWRFELLTDGQTRTIYRFALGSIAPNSESEPDIAVVRIDVGCYCDRHPPPENVFLIIEISNSTFGRGRIEKAKR